MSVNYVIGLYYFNQSILNAEYHINLLNNFSLPMLPNLPPNTIFQQESAPLATE